MDEQTRDPPEVWVLVSPACSCPVQVARIEERHARAILNHEVPSEGEHIACYVPKSELEAARVRIGLLLARIEHLESQK